MATFDTRDGPSIMRAFQRGDLSAEAALTLLEPISGGTGAAAQFFNEFIRNNPRPVGSPQESPGGQTPSEVQRLIAEQTARGELGTGAAGRSNARKELVRAGASAALIEAVLGTVPDGPSAAPRAGQQITTTDIDPAREFLESESGTIGGRGGLFRDFSAAQFGNLPSRFAPAIAAQFRPLSAAFSLSRLGPAGENQQLDDFRGFIGGNRQPFNPGQFDTALDAVAPLFDPIGGRGGDLQGRIDAFTGSAGTVPNVIRQSFGNSGFARGILDRLIGQRISAFRDATPGIGDDELFAAFLGNRQLVGGGFTR